MPLIGYYLLKHFGNAIFVLSFESVGSSFDRLCYLSYAKWWMVLVHFLMGLCLFLLRLALIGLLSKDAKDWPGTDSKLTFSFEDVPSRSGLRPTSSTMPWSRLVNVVFLFFDEWVAGEGGGRENSSTMLSKFFS